MKPAKFVLGVRFCFVEETLKNFMSSQWMSFYSVFVTPFYHITSNIQGRENQIPPQQRRKHHQRAPETELITSSTSWSISTYHWPKNIVHAQRIFEEKQDWRAELQNGRPPESLVDQLVDDASITVSAAQQSEGTWVGSFKVKKRGKIITKLWKIIT